MGRYLDLLRVGAENGSTKLRHYDTNDTNDTNDQSHAEVEQTTNATRIDRGSVVNVVYVVHQDVSTAAESAPNKPATPPIHTFEPIGHDLFEALITRWHIANRTLAEAKRLAWGELQNRWHMAHGKQVPRHLCAGCGERIADSSQALDLIDGNRVHDTDCLIRHGERWRSVASRALIAIGMSLHYDINDINDKSP
jgi:hypothetical protein